MKTFSKICYTLLIASHYFDVSITWGIASLLRLHDPYYWGLELCFKGTGSKHVNHPPRILLWITLLSTEQKTGKGKRKEEVRKDGTYKKMGSKRHKNQSSLRQCTEHPSTICQQVGVASWLVASGSFTAAAFIPENPGIGNKTVFYIPKGLALLSGRSNIGNRVVYIIILQLERFQLLWVSKLNLV